MRVRVKVRVTRFPWEARAGISTRDDGGAHEVLRPRAEGGQARLRG